MSRSDRGGRSAAPARAPQVQRSEAGAPESLASWSLTVTDPGYKGRLLATHEGLSRRDAVELVAIYRAMGYPPACLAAAVATPEARAA